MGLQMGFLSLLLLSLVCSAHAQQKGSVRPPSIQHFNGLENHALLIEPGVSISLKCAGEGSSVIDYKWFKDGVSLSDNPVAGLSVAGDQGQTLTSEGTLDETHVGYYHCLANNSKGTAKSESVYITTSLPSIPNTIILPKFVAQPESEIKQLGDAVIFECSAKGDPQPDIVWSKDGVELHEYNDMTVFKIPKLSKSDIGTYSCNISNMYGYDYKTVFTDILPETPTIGESPRNRTVSVGMDLNLKCSASKGYPEPTISWTFDGKPITDFEEMKLSPNNNLNITPVSTKHNQGVFTCIAENSLGKDMAHVQFKVVSETTIVEGPRDIKVQVTDDVVLDCVVAWDQSYPLTTSWRKDIDNEIKSDGVKFIIAQNNSLIIKNVDFADKGTYTCIAATQVKTDTNSGSITVSGISPVVVQGPQDATVSEGTSIELACEVTGNPTPHHNWFKDTSRLNIDHNKFRVYDNGTLKINQLTVNDTGKYICKAENSVSFSTASGFLDVRRRTKVIKNPDNAVIQNGGNIIFDCPFDVDEHFKTNVDVLVEWYKNDQKLTVSPVASASDDVEGHEYEEETTETPLVDENVEYRIFPNHSIMILNADPDDAGEYMCKVNTPIDQVIIRASLYSEETNNNYLIIMLILIILAILAIILLILCIIWVRRKAKRQGGYGVKDIENGKKLNRLATDIHYSIDDDDIDAKERSLLDPDKSAATPIFTPKTLKQLSDITKGSENSLLNLTEEDLYLRKGMDEDGSFRGGYLE